MSKKLKDKVNKKRIQWKEIIFELHRFDISDAYQLFRNNHPRMSINRCAYNVLKTYYSTAAMRYLKRQYEDTTLNHKETVEWFQFHRMLNNI